MGESKNSVTGRPVNAALRRTGFHYSQHCSGGPARAGDPEQKFPTALWFSTPILTPQGCCRKNWAKEATALSKSNKEYIKCFRTISLPLARKAAQNLNCSSSNSWRAKQSLLEICFFRQKNKNYHWETTYSFCFLTRQQSKKEQPLVRRNCLKDCWRALSGAC